VACHSCLKMAIGEKHKYLCKDCEQVWYCSKKCQKQSLKEHLLLCSIFKQLEETDIGDKSTLRVVLQTLARGYLEKITAGTANGMTFNSVLALQYHTDNFTAKEKEQLYKMKDFLEQVFKDRPFLDNNVDLIELICRQITNGFGIQEADGAPCEAYGCFPTASYFNHSCSPNVGIMHGMSKPNIIFYAREDIDPQTEVNITYIPLRDCATLSTGQRRHLLMQQYAFFFCHCSNCEQEEEL